MSRIRILVGIALIGSSGLIGSAYLFAGDPREDRRPGSAAPATANMANGAVAEHHLRVESGNDLPEGMKLQLASLINRLNKSKIPTNRTRMQYFLANSLAKSRQIIGWDAVLADAQEVPGGLLAKLRVSARRKGAIDSLSYYEIYLVNGGGAKLVGWEEDPNRNTDVVGH
jgi:hypothetical protein